MIELVDTHCHIQSAGNPAGERHTRELWAKDPELTAATLVKAAAEDGVTRLICVGCDLEDSKLALLQSAKKTLMEESNFDTDDLPDEIDLASSEYAQSMVFRLRDREKFLLKKIEKALARIEDGTFGVCERCEEPISAKRLEARPVTTLCIRCKEEQEKMERSFG